MTSRPAKTERVVASIVEEMCTLCGACVDVCPDGAITLGEDAAQIDAQKCSGCGVCVEACPAEAIVLG